METIDVKAVEMELNAEVDLAFVGVDEVERGMPNLP